MEFLEKNLEDIIYETDNSLLRSRGLFINGKKKRQVILGNYGIADMITYQRIWRHLEIQIFEFKKDAVDFNTFSQSLKYYTAIQSFLNKRNSKRELEYAFLDYTISINLVGKYIDMSNNFIYLPNFVNHLRIYTYDYGFDGIKFETHNSYKLINEGF